MLGQRVGLVVVLAGQGDWDREQSGETGRVGVRGTCCRWPDWEKTGPKRKLVTPLSTCSVEVSLMLL